MDAIRLLKSLAKAFVVTLGITLYIPVMVREVYQETRLYTDPKFEGFWDEVEAYHLKRDSRKTIMELSRRYGAVPVVTYIEQAGLATLFFPNEDALFASSMGTFLKEKDKYGQLYSLFSWGIALVVLYGPIFVAARQIQRFLTKIVCLRGAAREARKDYFTASDERRHIATFVAFGLALGLSMVNAWTKLTPELKQAGITFLDLTIVQLMLAYFGGMWMRIVSYGVDTAFLAVGVNPHLSLWDDVIAVTAISPVLWGIYHNSMLTIASNVAIGITEGLFVKWSYSQSLHRRDSVANIRPTIRSSQGN